MRTMAVLFLALSGVGCGGQTMPASPEDAIMRASEGWEEAARAGDAAALAELYAPDAVLLPPGAPPVRGRERIRQMFAEQFAGFEVVEMAFQTDEIRVTGDSAYRMGSYEVVIRPSEGAELHANDKFIEIWRREENGDWLITRDIWNSSESPNAPG